jgi:hypothetical protein
VVFRYENLGVSRIYPGYVCRNRPYHPRTGPHGLPRPWSSPDPGADSEVNRSTSNRQEQDADSEENRSDNPPDPTTWCRVVPYATPYNAMIAPAAASRTANPRLRLIDFIPAPRAQSSEAGSCAPRRDNGKAARIGTDLPAKHPEDGASSQPPSGTDTQRRVCLSSHPCATQRLGHGAVGIPMLALVNPPPVGCLKPPDLSRGGTNRAGSASKKAPGEDRSPFLHYCTQRRVGPSPRWWLSHPEEPSRNSLRITARSTSERRLET